MATGIELLGKILQAGDYQVGEHSKFGGVDAGAHSSGSYHYSDKAIDVNADNSGNETARLDELYKWLNANKAKFGIVELLWQVDDHYDHLHVAIEGDGGALRDEVKGGGVGGIIGKFIPGVGAAGKNGVGGAVGGAVDAGLDAGRAAAEAMLGLIFEVLGEEGPRILLYITLVLGGVASAAIGLGRMMGLGRPKGATA